MILTAASFAVLLIAIRVLTTKFHTIEIVFFRAVFGVTLIVPVVIFAATYYITWRESRAARAAR